MHEPSITFRYPNKELADISSCYAGDKLLLTSPKTQLVTFISYIIVFSDKKLLPVTKDVKCLGLSIDRDLKFKFNVGETQKTSQQINVLSTKLQFLTHPF